MPCLLSIALRGRCTAAATTASLMLVTIAEIPVLWGCSSMSRIMFSEAGCQGGHRGVFVRNT